MIYCIQKPLQPILALIPLNRGRQGHRKNSGVRKTTGTAFETKKRTEAPLLNLVNGKMSCVLCLHLSFAFD